MSILSSPPIRFSGDRAKCHNLSSRALTLYKTVVSAADRAGLKFISRDYKDDDGSTFSFRASKGGYDTWNGSISINGVMLGYVQQDNVSGNHGFIYQEDVDKRIIYTSYREEDKLEGPVSTKSLGGFLDWSDGINIVTWTALRNRHRYSVQPVLVSPIIYLNGEIYNTSTLLNNRAICGCAYKDDVLLVFASDVSDYSVTNYFFFKNEELVYTNTLDSLGCAQLVCVNQNGTEAITKLYDNTSAYRTIISIDFSDLSASVISKDSLVANSSDSLVYNTLVSPVSYDRTYSTSTSGNDLFLFGDYSNNVLQEVRKTFSSSMVSRSYQTSASGIVSVLLDNAYSYNSSFVLNGSEIGTHTESLEEHWDKTSVSFAENLLDPGDPESGIPPLYQITGFDRTYTCTSDKTFAVFNLGRCDLRYGIISTYTNIGSNIGSASAGFNYTKDITDVPPYNITGRYSGYWPSVSAVEDMDYQRLNVTSTSVVERAINSINIYSANTTSTAMYTLINTSWGIGDDIFWYLPFNNSSTYGFSETCSSNPAYLLISDFYGNSLYITDVDPKQYYIFDNTGLIKNISAEKIRTASSQEGFDPSNFIAGL